MFSVTLLVFAALLALSHHEAGFEPATLTLGLCYLGSDRTQNKKWNMVTRSTECSVSLAPTILWPLAHNCRGLMENWDILLFLLQSPLYLCGFLILLPRSLFTLSLASCPIHPSLPILIISLSSSLRLPLVPSSLASYLNCCACRRTPAGQLPAAPLL